MRLGFQNSVSWLQRIRTERSVSSYGDFLQLKIIIDSLDPLSTSCRYCEKLLSGKCVVNIKLEEEIIPFMKEALNYLLFLKPRFLKYKTDALLVAQLFFVLRHGSLNKRGFSSLVVAFFHLSS